MIEDDSSTLSIEEKALLTKCCNSKLLHVSQIFWVQKKEKVRIGEWLLLKASSGVSIIIFEGSERIEIKDFNFFTPRKYLDSIGYNNVIDEFIDISNTIELKMFMGKKILDFEIISRYLENGIKLCDNAIKFITELGSLETTFVDGNLTLRCQVST